MITAETFPVFFKVLFIWKVNLEKRLALPTEKFFPVAIVLRTQSGKRYGASLSNFRSLSIGHLQEVKNRKFQSFSSKHGHGRLEEEVVYKGFQI